MHDLTKALLEATSGSTLRLLPCTITSLAPLTVTLLGDSIQCAGIAGVAYTEGPAVVLWAPGTAPIALRLA